MHSHELLNRILYHVRYCSDVALDPDRAYDIITDRNNRRVFKNIKEVVFRKVLEDNGNRLLVEVEQLGRWRFLMLSGTFASRVIVEQNRSDKSVRGWGG